MLVLTARPNSVDVLGMLNSNTSSRTVVSLLQLLAALTAVLSAWQLCYTSLYMSAAERQTCSPSMLTLQQKHWLLNSKAPVAGMLHVAVIVAVVLYRKHMYCCCLQDGLEVKTKDKEMRRVLSLFQLSAFGISAIVGGGIFVVTGVQAKLNAG